MLSAIPNFNYFAANEKGNKLELCHQKSNTVLGEVTARELSCSRNKTHVLSGKPIFKGTKTFERNSGEKQSRG